MNEISIEIGRWYDQNRRDLPWRNTRDAYKIWLSEVILQQTRVAQGLDYYLRFVKAYPTVSHLAAATQDDVLKLWQGLGYYSRARNLHKAAMTVAAAGGTMPTRYDQLRRLSGIGPYTAAAIASFAADEDVPVVDGNVYRVLSRLYDIATPIDTTAGQHTFSQLAQQMLINPSSHHNQAMMEFGALQCTPASPRCDDCPVAAHCLALAHETVSQRPVKQGHVKVRERHLAYIIYIYKDTLWVHQRGASDIWQGLWEFVLYEDKTPSHTPTDAWEDNLEEGECILKLTHQLTHQRLLASFHVVRLSDELDDPRQHPAIAALPDSYRQVTWLEWQELAVPRLIDQANQRLSAWF